MPLNQYSFFQENLPVIFCVEIIDACPFGSYLLKTANNSWLAVSKMSWCFFSERI